MFNGDAIPLNRPKDFNLQDWLNGKGANEGTGGHGIDKTEPIIKAAIKYLREEKGFKKVGAVGYCFGGKYVVRELDAEENGGLDVGYVAHPSFVEEKELLSVKGPLSIAAAGKSISILLPAPFSA